jgi:hypothetical protein
LSRVLFSMRAVVVLLAALVASASAGRNAVIPGVHVPLPIDPTVQLVDTVWLNLAYLIFLRRPHGVCLCV